MTKTKKATKRRRGQSASKAMLERTVGSTVDISRGDLTVLVHWATYGHSKALAGYKFVDAVDIINFHRSRIRPTTRKAELARSNAALTGERTEKQ